MDWIRSAGAEVDMDSLLACQQDRSVNKKDSKTF
jgi:hypothetical protein